VPKPHTYGNGDGYSHGHGDSYIDANRYGYSNVYAYSHINGHVYADSYGNGDIYAYTYSNTDLPRLGELQLHDHYRLVSGRHHQPGHQLRRLLPFGAISLPGQDL
jgi:hypothetical protein